MNGLEQIQESIKQIICEKKQEQKQIIEIEEKRIKLSQERNEKKKIDANNIEVYELGKQIAELGNQSQELQNKLDSKIREIKVQIGLNIDNLIAEGIRKIRLLNEEKQEIQDKISNQEDRNQKYQLQKQEFYVRFGRMPELSENAIREIELQKQENKLCMEKIEQIQLKEKQLEEEITELAKIKRNWKNGEWELIIVTKGVEAKEIASVQQVDEVENEEFYIQEVNVEEIQTIEEIQIEQIEPIEELYVEEFEPIQELYIEEFEPIEEIYVEEFSEETEKIDNSSLDKIEKPIDEIEELAKAIVEEIVAEQTKDISHKEEISDDIITFEEKIEKTENKDKVLIPLFGQKAKISNIIVKFEEAELVYKAVMSDGNEIKIYPSKIGAGNVLLRDKQNRTECKEILMNYAVAEYRVLDKNVITKIDPLICELLIECSEKYSYDAQELIYNYAMSYSKVDNFDADLVPTITYNLSYIEKSKLNRKEKMIIRRICKNARRNTKIEIIETFAGFRKIKYILKRIFAVNNIKVLPEAKY